MKKLAAIGIPVVVVLILISIAFSYYNGLVTSQEGARTAWAQVENQYQRRADLLPNLVETVKGVAAQERGVYEEVTRLRSQWGQAMSGGDLPSRMEAARGLDLALSRLLVVVERYPDIKFNQNFLTLQAQLEGTENRLSVERKRFNDAVLSYNTKVRTYPGAWFASMFGFERIPLFEAEKGAREVPKVKF